MDEEGVLLWSGVERYFRKHPYNGILRDRCESLKVTLDMDYNFEPPAIAHLLAFTVKFEEKQILEVTSKIKVGVRNEQWEEAEKYTQALSNMIKADARLADELEPDLLDTLIKFLRHGYDLKIQSHAANILRHVIAYSNNNKDFVMKFLTTSIVVNLISSLDCTVQEEAVWILRTMALAFSDRDGHKAILEASLEPLGSLFAKSNVKEVLYGGAKALEAICQVHPMLPNEKLKYVVLSLLKLLESEHVNIVSSACLGLALLCDGRERMVVDEQDFEPLIDRIIDLIDSDSRVQTLGGLIALGSIVRWGSDDDIEIIIIKMEALWSLECLIRCEKDKYIVKESCWIISNITARTENFIREVINCECIDPLANIVENYELLDVKMEAACAIINAIHGVSSDQFEGLKNKCGKPIWNLIKLIWENRLMLFLCLEGLVKLEAVKVTWGGEERTRSGWLIQFKELLASAKGAEFQLVNNIDGLTKPKKLPRIDNIHDVACYLTCTFTEQQHPDMDNLYIYSISGDDLNCVWMGNQKMADQMKGYC